VLRRPERGRGSLLRILDLAIRLCPATRCLADRCRLDQLPVVRAPFITHQAQAARAERDVALFKVRREAENDLSDPHLRSQLIARLPEIAAAMPQPRELRAVSIASDGAGTPTALVGFLASVLQLAEGALKGPGRTAAQPTEEDAGAGG
jgi:hypothetical protein